MTTANKSIGGMENKADETKEKESTSLEANDDVDALEKPEQAETASKVSETSTSKKKVKLGGRLRGLISHMNIYLLLFILILVLSGGIVFVGVQRSQKDASDLSIDTQELTAETLEKLQGSETKVGDPKQLLSIESNTVFSGKVLIQDNLDVAGTIKVGGSLNLPGLTVGGTSNFDVIRANALTITGNTTIQGDATIQKALKVTGSGSFGGPISAPQITIDVLRLNGDLQFNRHLDAGGGTPGSSGGNALGAGGTASVSGTDTAGTVTVNTGGSANAGCFITVNFTQAFNGTPHVVATANDPDAASLGIYINRSITSFSICTVSNPPDGASFGFDYIVID